MVFDDDDDDWEKTQVSMAYILREDTRMMQK